jgi:23S rRNA (uracil1939-C5)-methyltransferase
LFDEVKVDIDAHCFLQSSFESDRILQEFITKHALDFGADLKAIDLFCGRGTYTLPLSRYGKVDGFESDPKALEALSKAAKAASRDIELTKQDLFNNPVQTELLSKYNFAVINPPRAGAKEQVIELSQSSIKTIIYISCNPETFAQDAQILIKNNYQLTEVTAFDQFYWSPHLEVIGIFKKIP